jgi:cell division protein FtsB
MKKMFAVILIALLMLGFLYKGPITEAAENALYYSKCDEPRTFRIGSIDPKYNMTQDEFLLNIQSAARIWSDGYGKQLFAYDPKGDIEINLVYDQRSFLSSQITDLDSKIKQQQQALDPEIASYKERAAQFRDKVAQLNNDIDYWNSRGGAPENEYESLKSRQTSLRQEAEALSQEAERLNQSTEEFNQQVGQLHQTVDTFNSALQYKPEEGEYIFDNGKETINIYFDNSKTELIHTLAHELGHSLGIGHNNSEVSIMFPKTTKITTLSTEDLAALTETCEKKNVIALTAERLMLIINQLEINVGRN